MCQSYLTYCSMAMASLRCDSFTDVSSLDSGRSPLERPLFVLGSRNYSPAELGIEHIPNHLSDKRRFFLHALMTELDLASS